MESITDIDRFLNIDVYDGYGNGTGYSTGYSTGYGAGCSTGKGSYRTGCGYGTGYGYGNGNGTGYSTGYSTGCSTGKGSYRTGCGYGTGYGYGNGNGNGYSTGYGAGCGYGTGGGAGCSTGYGTGGGSGYSTGYGTGGGSGYGSYSTGYGYSAGLISFNGFRVNYIDGMATVIKRVKDNLAKGFIINSDLTTENCYVVKNGSLFAHGRTLEEARKALQDKIFNDMDTDEKIDLFLETFNLTDEYPAKDFYEWHHILTGSCEMGRNVFVKNHGIDLENDKYTVIEFIDLTKDDYGGDIIKTLEERISE